jgi:YggT family protein
VIVAEIALWVLYAFIALMLVRLVMEYVMMFARNFRPAGIVAAVLEIAYTVTDPPLRALRRIIPPLRLGNVSLDLAFVVLIIGAYVLVAVTVQYVH